MRNKALVFFACLFITFSCQDSNSGLIIPEEKLHKIIFDFHTAEHIINRAPTDLKDSLKSVYQQQIFSIYEVKKEDFLHDLNLLQQNPKKFLEVYEKIEKYGLDLKNNTLKKLNENMIKDE